MANNYYNIRIQFRTLLAVILNKLKSTLKNLSRLTLRFINALKKIANLFKQICE